MKAALFSAAVVLATLVPALAINDADIAPAALAGKTLTFTIVNGTAPFATNGTWTGTFATTGATDFTVANVTGNTVNITTSQTGFSTGAGFTEINLAEFIQGRASAVLTLYYDANGVGGFEVFINGLFGASVNGTFAIGTTAPRIPDITVRLASGKEIQNDAPVLDIGGAVVGKSISQSFTIKNTGSAPLKNLAITIDGKNKADFTTSSLKKNQLGIDDSIDFKVTFKPKNFGTRKATVRIQSNDPNEDPFKIRLTGSGARIK